MSPQRYERVNAQDEDDKSLTKSHSPVPQSPPPSFRSRTSSPSSRQLTSEHDPLVSDADRTLADTFDSPSDDEADEEGRSRGDDRQRLMRASSSERRAEQAAEEEQQQQQQQQPVVVSPRDGMQRRVTELPTFSAAQAGARVYGGGSMANDGVFANLSAKPVRGDTDHVEEKPPTYEQAAADATPPYWETTIHLAGLSSPDEVFVDGLPVGSLFSFLWNGMISMSFQIVGFLLTYLLHTTHAAKNGSLAGLGITLVQYGFSLKGSGSSSGGGAGGPGGADAPPDPNSHDFDPDALPNGGAGVGSGMPGDVTVGLTKWDWFAYLLMIVGWFILIRSVSDFLRARKHEQLVLQSPDRGLPVPIVAEGERPEHAV